MKQRLRAVVADDEEMSRARLCRLLGQVGDVDIVAQCADGDTAVAAIRRLRPEVAFLDVRMPQLNGFGVLDALPPTLRPSVVFVTAHADHALRAFEADATDYLLKPYSADRLRAALARVRRELGAAMDSIVPPERDERYARRLAVPVGARLQLLAVDEIDCVLAQSNYVELCVGDRRYLLRETMASLETRLDPRRFVRVHRSHLVRLDAVRDIETLEAGRYLIRLGNGLRVSSGASYRQRLRAAFGLGGVAPP
ncbi:LytR/AlgR family response regulator transcription factor [Lysobacter cavernae]|uniref:LytR/AlgR family response regulator transcription factor n=1 Tax=Lysobacter cavernae TaxID=1685901 RepID=A0ABV7RMM9_9GAMM